MSVSSSLVPAVVSVLIFLPPCPSAAFNPGLGMPWAASNGDFMWEDEFYSTAKKPSTSSLNPRLTWLGKGGTQKTEGLGGGAGPLLKSRGGGVAMVKRHPSAAVSYAARKRQSYLTMPYHPLARFRGIDTTGPSSAVIGPYRPSGPFVLPLGVATYGGPRSEPVHVVDVQSDGEDEDELEKTSDQEVLNAGQLLTILAAVARDKGLGLERNRLSKGIRFGITRRR
ncbi:uncharacterized protein LOC124166827 [Ischnura elegans]|uniref:uncharacterized protein LOC124166827 n=1 Tax=Ischnura elegans TaxID=197161 RepID=UPI001ED86B4D|nr:uncharacterized protein LOC124166827 [Ischnura elegans]